MSSYAKAAEQARDIVQGTRVELAMARRRTEPVIQQQATCGCGWKHVGQGWMQAGLDHALVMEHKVEFNGSIDGREQPKVPGVLR